ncbi:MAG: hypothetical protein KBG28_12980 [Kofleriaceae bacterium]|nr:hypothetical protein [Kofleriaceae bacterium]MBP6841202.1 hypothetical protein [Kofleriaceae bacterium]MBP9204877.1 hypothetical protein [Kofleriaceae bacterium]
MTGAAPAGRRRLVAGGLALLLGLGVSGGGLWWLRQQVARLHRVELPGQVEVTLSAAGASVYAEHHEGEAEPTGDYACVVTSAAGQRERMRPASAATSYDLAGRRGRLLFEVYPRAAGRFQLWCQAPGPMHLAYGSPVGGAASVLAVAGLVPALAGLGLLGTAVWARRRRRA